MPTPTKFDKLISPKERRAAVDLLGRFITALPPDAYERVAKAHGIDPNELMRQIDGALVRLAADVGNPKARQIIHLSKERYPR